DSLSDSGNLASVVGPFPQPPYYQNRVSNGLLAVEVMANRLGLTLEPSLHLIGPAQGTNYSVVAARANSNEPKDLATQVALFLANHGGVAPENALYVMFIGGNDVRYARDNPSPIAAYQSLTDAAVVIADQIQVLSMAGARNWLVINAPDIGNIPETRLIAQALGLPGLINHATALSLYFNNELKARVNQVKEDMDIEVERFDLLKKFNKIADKSLKLGFSNNTDPCFSTNLGQYTPGCNFGLNIDEYVFFDEIHPTARIHAIIGEMLYRKVADEDAEKEKEKEQEQD
ncbi:MAG: SGNH/GDSL hydrolase family protein, partial [Gammaproteobacteria bacterium]|nr:SGNH/GDSL hydrolase family protein [Gammaproteobacteria bacterium]